MSAVEPSRFYLTTPIYYASGPPHIGHAYTTIVGDALARYQRTRRGPGNAYYLTGTDEHGEKIERAAMAHSQTPQAFVDDIASQYRTAWQALDIRYDDFIRTTSERHKQGARRLWEKLVASGDIYLDDYEDWYCVGCESFKTEKELLPGNICPDHKKPVEKVAEKPDDSGTGELIVPPTRFGQVQKSEDPRGPTILAPNDTIKSCTVPEGFEIKLFADEKRFPGIGKPVQMTFDNKGRLWVSTMPSYPQWKPGDPKPQDKLLILEDLEKILERR